MKQLSDAFYEYNIIENNEYLLINNYNYTYQKIKKGDIVFVSKYKYNLTINGKFHLFLIIKKYGTYIYGMIITSKIEKEWYPSNIPIKKNNKNNLKYNSLIKTDNIYIISKENIINKIGTINNSLLERCIILNKIN